MQYYFFLFLTLLDACDLSLASLAPRHSATLTTDRHRGLQKVYTLWCTQR